METFSALLAICAENSPVPGEFPARRPVTLSFDVFFDLRPNKRLSKQLWGWREIFVCSCTYNDWARHTNKLQKFIDALVYIFFSVSLLTWIHQDYLMDM